MVATATSTSSRRTCSTVTAEKCGWTRLRSAGATFPATRLEGAVFRHPFLERDSLGILADHVTLEQGTGAVHTAPGHGQEDYVVGPTVRHRDVYCPVDAAGRFFRAEGAAGHLPEELIGKTVWEANPIVIEILQAARRAARRMKRSSTAIRTAGAATIRPSSAPPSSGSSAWSATTCASDALEAIRHVKWMPDLGRGAHLQHDRRRGPTGASRASACGACRSSSSTATAAASRSPIATILDRVVELFAEHTADVWYERTAAELLPAGHDVRQVRRRGVQQGNRHSGCLVRFRIEPPRGAHASEPTCPGRPISTSKAATSIAAGSTVRCWWAWG